MDMERRILNFKELRKARPDTGINVFLCYSPFQVFVANMITSQFLDTAGKARKINVLVKQQQITVEDKFDYVLETRPGLRKIADVRKAKKMYDFLAKSFNDVTFFIPHTAGILGYYIFDSLKNKYPHINVNLFYEGILCLNDYDYSFISKSSEIKQRLVISKLLGLNYKFTGKIFPGFSPQIKNIYTFFPDLTEGSPDKIIPIKINSYSFTPVPGRVIILGQKPSFIPDDIHNKLFMRIITDIKKGGYTEIFYKRHYSDESNFFDRLASEAGIKYNIIDPFRPIEEIITQYKPQTVVSLISSALINLSGIYGGSLQLRSYCPPFTKDDPNAEMLTKITEVFKKIGVPNTDIDLADESKN